MSADLVFACGGCGAVIAPDGPRHVCQPRSILDPQRPSDYHATPHDVHMPPSLEQRARAAGLRWERRQEINRPVEWWLCDWWGVEYGFVKGDVYNYTAHDERWFSISDDHTTPRAAQEAVLQRWADQQDKEKP